MLSVLLLECFFIASLQQILFPDKHTRNICSTKNSNAFQKNKTLKKARRVGSIRIRQQYAKKVRVPFYQKVTDDPSCLYKILFYPMHKQIAEIAKETLISHRTQTSWRTKRKTTFLAKTLKLIIKRDGLPATSKEKKYTCITCALGDTIQHVQQHALREFNVTDNTCKLCFQTSGPLNPSKSLFDYGITDGATLILITGGLKSGAPFYEEQRKFVNLEERVRQNEEVRTQEERRQKNLKAATNRAQQREQQKQQRKKQKKQNYNKNHKKISRQRILHQKTHHPAEQKSKFLAQEKKHELIKTFEKKLKNITHHHCTCCRWVSINLPMSCNKNMCKTCKQLDPNYWLEQKLLPVWYNNNNQPQYRVPKELSELTDAEKMLIQKASVFIPLHHIKHGTLGLKGHSCCFPQDVQQMCTVLPRLPTEVTVVKLIQKYRDSIGGEGNLKTFRVRKKQVLRALHWLKKYNPEYKDITISPANMNWMGDEPESNLPTNMETVIRLDGTEVLCIARQFFRECIHY